MRERIEHALECWGKFAYRRAGWVLAVSILVVAALATQLPKIAFDTSTEGFFTKDDPIRIAYDAFRERFGSDTLTLIAVRPPDVFDLGFLEKLRAFHEALEDEVPLVVEVTSLINARETRGEADELIVGELLEDWPTSEADLAQLKQRVMANPLYVDQLVSRNAGVTTVVIESEVYSRLGTDEGFDDFDDGVNGWAELVGNHDGNLDNVITAPVAGYFRTEVTLLENVNAGQQLGTICSAFGEILAKITTEHTGIIIMLRRIHRVHSGDGLIHITQRLE